MNKLKYIVLVILTILIIGCSSSLCSLQAVAGGSTACHEEVVNE